MDPDIAGCLSWYSNRTTQSFPSLETWPFAYSFKVLLSFSQLLLFSGSLKAFFQQTTGLSGSWLREGKHACSVCEYRVGARKEDPAEKGIV